MQGAAAGAILSLLQDSFYFVIGDYGNTNTSNTLTQQLSIIYNAPFYL